MQIHHLGHYEMYHQCCIIWCSAAPFFRVFCGPPLGGILCVYFEWPLFVSNILTFHIPRYSGALWHSPVHWKIGFLSWNYTNVEWCPSLVSLPLLLSMPAPFSQIRLEELSWRNSRCRDFLSDRNVLVKTYKINLLFMSKKNHLTNTFELRIPYCTKNLDWKLVN